MNLQEIDKNLNLKNWKYYLNDLKITTIFSGWAESPSKINLGWGSPEVTLAEIALVGLADTVKYLLVSNLSLKQEARLSFSRWVIHKISFKVLKMEIHNDFKVQELKYQAHSLNIKINQSNEQNKETQKIEEIQNILKSKEIKKEFNLLDILV